MIKTALTISTNVVPRYASSLSHIQKGKPLRTERLDDELSLVAVLFLVSGVIGTVALVLSDDSWCYVK